MKKHMDFAHTDALGYEAGPVRRAPLVPRRLWPGLFFLAWGVATIAACVVMAMVAWG